MPDGYRRQRTTFGDWSGALPVTALTGQTTLVTHRSGATIYLQRAHVTVSGLLAGGTWRLKDSAGVELTGPISVAATTTGVDVDFGANGLSLTAGSDLVFVPSATGATGAVTWDAYQKPGLTQATTIDRSI